MTNILGFQTLKICDPHGLTDLIVVKIEGNCLACFSPNFNWIKLQEGPNNFGFGFRATNELDEYNINWNVDDVWNLDYDCIGKISLCVFDEELTPIIAELLSIEDNNESKIMKFKIFEQFLYNFESEEHIKIEPITTSVTMYHDKYDYNFSPEIIFANISNSYEIAGNFFENKNNISVEEYDKNLEEITIPSTAESIENFTFFGFNNLISVNIPDSVISIGETAFFGCKSLINIFVDEKSNEYSSIDGVLFDKKLQTLIAYPQNKKMKLMLFPIQ